jgi:hypothetical protein
MTSGAWKAPRAMSAFWLYWMSTTLSYLGDGARFVAIPLLAATLTSSPAQVASVALAAGLPWPLLGLLAGVLVDRVNKNRLLSGMQAVRAFLGFSIAFAVADDRLSLGLLAALVFSLNSCEVFYDVALHSFLPSIVEEARLQWANSRLIAAETVVFEFVGPAIGGFLFARNTSLPFFFDAATFLFSAWALRALSRRGRQPSIHDHAARSSIMSELADGIRWFRSHDLVRSLTFVGASINVGAGGLFAVLVLFVKEDLSSGAGAYGILIATGATGAIIGGLAASRLTRARARRTICMCAAPLTALFLVVIAGSGSYLVTAASLIASGMVVAIVNVVTISLRQSLTPAPLIGRVTAVHRVLCWGAVPLGAGLTGLAGQFLGVRAAIAICGAVVLVLSAITLPGFLRVTSETFAPAAR